MKTETRKMNRRYKGSTELGCMSLHQLRHLLKELHGVLYMDGPDTLWDSDTTQAIAELMAESGLGPPVKLTPVDVLFRVDKPSKEVTAVLSTPGAVTFNGRGEADCYAHVGQHSTCHVAWYLQRTRKAKPEEFAALKRELESIGYAVNVKAKRKVR